MSDPSATVRRPTAVLAEDHRETAERLKELLQTAFDVVALVEDGRALVSAAARLSPDLIVTDISMPGLDGIEAARVIRGRDPDARIVFVSVHSELILVERGLATGAFGYVWKESAGDELVDAGRAALAGRQFISRDLRREPDRRRAD